jgi:N-acetylglutamate synthase-like GNAT family acetyltransferase
MILRAPATDKEWREYYDLRWQVLRKPLGMEKGTERDDREGQSFHVMACDDQRRVIGVGRLHFNSSMEAQIRYMGVAEDCRLRGVGRAMLMYLEGVAKERGMRTIVLNARQDVAGFYASAGYEVTGPGPTMFGKVRHVRMAKELLAAKAREE